MNMLQTILKRLDGASMADMRRLSELSGVPFHTIYKIKRGETADPGVKTAEALFQAISLQAQ